jgi:hypothetical protein
MSVSRLLRRSRDTIPAYIPFSTQPAASNA